MMKRGSTGGSMIRVEEEGEDLDDVEDEEDEDEDEDDGESSRMDQSIDNASADDSRQQQQHSLTQPQGLLALSSSMSRGRRLGRRASSVLLGAESTSHSLGTQAPAIPAAGDKGLRPHFLKERSATIMDLGSGSGAQLVGGLAVASGDQPAIPQSKASAFLMSILAKSRAVIGTGGSAGYAGGISVNHALRPSTTNSIHYKHHNGAEQGQRLRPLTGDRHASRTLSTLSHNPRSALFRQLSERSNGEDERHEDVGSDDPRQQQKEIPRELVAGLRRHRQQLPEVIAILTRIQQRLREFEVVDDEEQLPLCAAFVDADLLPELATLMREFRFHAYLHVSTLHETCTRQ